MVADRSFEVPTRESLGSHAPDRHLLWYDYAELWLSFPLGRVLDYGCGNGAFLQRLAARGADCTGVDIDAERVAVGVPEVRHRLTAIQPDEPLPFPNGSFDTVVILEVIEHVRDERAVLSELGRVLAPGGHLLLTTPHKGLLTFLDPGNVKFVMPRLHRFIHRTLLRRKAYYEQRFGDARRSNQGMIADFTVDQDPWHRHYRFEEIRSRAPAELSPVAWAVYFPAFRALWSLRLALNSLTFGRVQQLPWPLSAAYRRLSRYQSNWGDQLVVLFEKKGTNGEPIHRR